MSSDPSRNLFSLFKKKQGCPPPEPFNENSFEFSLKGGPYQSSLIVAAATLKKGKCKGEPLPLHCTWYRSARDSDFVEIEGIKGAFYQPNADDVGCKICVQALPICSESQEYSGMPAFAECGPIQLDPGVKRKVQECLANPSTFPVTVLRGLVNASEPTVVLINFSTDAVVLADEMMSPFLSFPVTPAYPAVLIDSKSSVLFSLLPDSSTTLEISCSDPVYRDTIALTARMLCGAKFARDRADLFLQLQQLNSSLTKAAKDKEQLTTQLTAIGLTCEEAQREKVLNARRIAEVEEALGRQSLEMAESRSELETHRQEEKFLRQDLHVYKSQCDALVQQLKLAKEAMQQFKAVASTTSAQLEEVVRCVSSSEVGLTLADSLVSIVHALRTSTSQETVPLKDSSAKSAKLSEESSTEGADSSEDRLLAEIKDLKETLARQTSETEDLRAEMSEQVDKLQAERNFYKRKFESVAQENDKLLSKLGKNPRELSAFEQTRQKFEAERMKLIKDKETAQTQAEFYLGLMESAERKLAEESRRNAELRILAFPRSKTDLKEFHNIINSMTQTLTEREAELREQKETNRTLMGQIAELQQQAR
jgi:hypothetical protein